MSSRSNRVYLLPWSGKTEVATEMVRRHYPETDIELIDPREFRELGWKGQMRRLRSLRGKAFIFFVQTHTQVWAKQLLAWSVLVHRARHTVLMDASGHVEKHSRASLSKVALLTAYSASIDVLVFLASALVLLYCRMFPIRRPFREGPWETDLAYLFPFIDRELAPGGAASHVRGFLRGAQKAGSAIDIYSAVPIPGPARRFTLLPKIRKHFVFIEAATLAYSFRYALQMRRELTGRRVGALYQRHGRFSFASALLVRWLRLPLILEYNSSEVWMAKFWDPARFMLWLRWCEQVVVDATSLFVVVSEPLKMELMAAGIEPERILVNPNAVDPEEFRPQCGGEQIRSQYGFRPGDVVIGFVGSFSYWHGVEVLQKAIENVYAHDNEPNVRFLLIGTGPLHEEIRQALSRYTDKGWVVFTGSLNHEAVPAHLDASDVLVSPHVPMPDGRPFFGSPTKLFEYMAIGKAIIASDLDQIGKVLRHNRTAWLVTPGDVAELSAAIEVLSRDPEMRRRLGNEARVDALASHTWELNATRVLQHLSIIPPKIQVTLGV
jgi:glycosyltransferase involved in cell wall biosynthesis